MCVFVLTKIAFLVTLHANMAKLVISFCYTIGNLGDNGYIFFLEDKLNIGQIDHIISFSKNANRIEISRGLLNRAQQINY